MDSNQTTEQEAQAWAKNYVAKMESARSWMKTAQDGVVKHISVRTPPSPESLDEPLRSRVIEILVQLGEIKPKTP